MALVKQAFSDANFSFMEETIYEDEVETGVIVCNTYKRTAEDQQGRLAGHLTAEGSSLDLKKSHCALKRVSKSTTAVSGVHAAATIKQESSGFVEPPKLAEPRMVCFFALATAARFSATRANFAVIDLLWSRSPCTMRYPLISEITQAEACVGPICLRLKGLNGEVLAAHIKALSPTKA